MNKQGQITGFVILLLTAFLFNNQQIKAQANPHFEETIPLRADTMHTGGKLTMSERIDNAFTPVVKVLGDVLFWDPFSAAGLYDPVVRGENDKPVKNKKGETIKAPLKLIVVWLIFGGLFFTVFMRFINIKAFGHAIQLIRGKYDKPGSGGEVSHFQALTTALSATVGLGNIAGVALAISIGGPGATLWMMLAGFLGMSSKFVECTLGVKYRKIDSKGRVSGGAMYYLRKGLKNRKLGWLGIILAALFAILVIGGSFGGGNMLQANQAFEQFASFFPGTSDNGAVYGLVLAFFVGLVIIGGIKSIARVTSRIVPIMALLYVGTAMVIIFINIENTGEAFSLIFNGAFSADAMKGGFIGVLIWGFQRGAFSNEAGVGSASIAHSAARTNEPVSEGIVALLEPFVDTIVVCTMTALVIIFTGYHEAPDGIEGVSLTSAAFASVFIWFPYLLLIAVTLFAFSTLISWSYYGQKGFDYLFGGWSEKLFGTRSVTDTIYRLLFLACIVIGSASNLRSVMDFSDMMVLCMAFPNIIGLLIMAPEVKRDLKDYRHRLKTGQIKKYK
ncbi:MAG: alanine:cation symporter family protein [Bacteroidales bacterium]|nr:alanine:cation symporter family protein [Bacteroidales bacterium]MCF8344571.1 alanine:cation symporter family protein [Bacteroidales bacterium]MCF8350688.1 alanine:cation symporter family protein [Bacteroidales bacterium]MCF8376981.1 alanine:cation symporter family protein [Bacteroidales bacterium]MCF8400866.1 alanine:cation symporter family protein [Bacteroidales bacterium]